MKEDEESDWCELCGSYHYDKNPNSLCNSCYESLEDLPPKN